MLSKFLTEYLIDAKIIGEDDKTIIQYGIYGLISTVLNIATILVIGAWCNCILESILFTITFYFLRIYAGGYHAKTPGKCYFFFSIDSFFQFWNNKQITFEIQHFNSYFYGSISHYFYHSTNRQYQQTVG